MSFKKLKLLTLVILFVGLVGVANASTPTSPPPYNFIWGDSVWIFGDLTAAGIDYGDRGETGVVVKTLHQTVDVTPGSNQGKSADIEVMAVNVYNKQKGITSGDKGYTLIPFQQNDVKYWANYYNGNPEYVWEMINNTSLDRIHRAHYIIEHQLWGRSNWINLATIRELSGGGGNPPEALNNHNNTQWSYYVSGQHHLFEFQKAIIRNLSNISPWPSIREFRINTGDEISEASSFIFDLSTYGVYDKQFHATFFVNGDTTGIKIPITPITTQYEMKFKQNVKVTDIPGLLEKIQSNQIANNTIKLVIEDGYGRTAEQQIQVAFKPLGDVYVIGEIIANPERKQFDGQDVGVEVTVRGTVIGLNEFDIKHWLITSRKEQDFNDRREILSGSHTTREHTFNFIIPKSAMNNVDEYIQNWVGQATVFDKNDRAYTHDPIVTETIVFKVADPQPPGPVCPPDVKPVSARIYDPRGLVFDEEPKITFEVTSYQQLDLEDWRIEIREEGSGRLVHRIMNETPIYLIDRFSRNGVNWDMYELDMPDGIEMGVKYTISVRVKEDDGLPAWCGKTSEKRDFTLATRPEADFTFPDEIYAGDDIPLTNTSTHPDDLPMTAEWRVTAPDGKLDSTGSEWDHEIVDSVIGYYDATLKIKDSIGGTDEVEHYIPVLDPKPQAVLNITGTPKENRKVTIDGSRSVAPTRFPIDVSKTKITIAPVTSGISTSEIKPSNIITGTLQQDILIKKEGIYKVELYVENSRGSDTTEKTIVIQPDIIPYVNFSFVDGQTLYTDPNDLLAGKPLASIPLRNESRSRDKDILQHNKWKVYFVQSFNGDIPVFPSEPDIQFEESEITEEGTVFNLLPKGLTPYISNVGSCDLCTFIVQNVDGQLIFKTSLFGYYLFELEVIEEFGQPTIEEFVTPEDRRRDTTASIPISEKIVLIDNRAPTVNWKE